MIKCAIYVPVAIYNNIVNGHSTHASISVSIAANANALCEWTLIILAAVSFGHSLRKLYQFINYPCWQLFLI